MKPLVFGWEADSTLVNDIVAQLNAQAGKLERRRFPDGESYLRILDDCGKRQVIVVAGLSQPDAKLMSLLLAAATLRDLGAASIGLVSPYLPYMRQDKAFNSGEGVTAKYVGSILSSHFDWLVTVDPHLHRIHDLSEVYSIPTNVLQAAPALANWLTQNIAKPLLIGPDSESEQWVAEVARQCNAPFEVLAKTRAGDRDVQVSAPDIATWPDHTPVLVDDIISSGQTMVQAIKGLVQQSSQPPVCLAVHGVFAPDAEAELTAAGAARIVTTNSIAHPSNAIDLSKIVARGCDSFID